MAWEEHSSAIHTCRNGIMKAKVSVEPNLVKDVKNTNNGFHKYIGQKRKTKDSVPSLINDQRELATTDMENAQILNQFFASDFTEYQASHASHVPEPLSMDWGNTVIVTVKKFQAG